MIAPFFFVAAAALGPAPCMLTLQPTTSVVADAAKPASGSMLDEKISLDLEKANVVDVLEKVASLLGATPIIDAGVDGTVTLKVTDVSVRRLLAMLEEQSKTTILFDGKRLVVTSAAGTARAGEREILRKLPRRPTKDVPPTSLPATVELESESGQRALVKLKSGPVSVVIPGCPGEIQLTPIGVDRFDGLLRLAVSSGATSSRIVTATPADAEKRPFTMLGPCRIRLSAGTGTLSFAPPSPAVPPSPPTPSYMVTVQLIEVSAEKEEEFFSPRVQTGEGQTFTVSGRFDQPGPGTRTVYVSGVVLPVAEGRVDLALVETILHDMDPKFEGEAMTVRLAHAEETLRVRLGETTRVTLSSRYVLGRSALVADVTVTKMERGW